QPESRWSNCRTFVAALRAAQPTEPRRGRWVRPAAAAAVLALLVIAGLAAWRLGPWTTAPPPLEPAIRTTRPHLDDPSPIVLKSGEQDGSRSGKLRAEGDPDPRVIAFISRGDDAFDAGDYLEAIEAYSEALVLDPNSVVAVNNRGNVYYKLGHHDAAI